MYFGFEEHSKTFSNKNMCIITAKPKKHALFLFVSCNFLVNLSPMLATSNSHAHSIHSIDEPIRITLHNVSLN